jgi:hypothetical protein
MVVVQLSGPRLLFVGPTRSAGGAHLDVDQIRLGEEFPGASVNSTVPSMFQATAAFPFDHTAEFRN